MYTNSLVQLISFINFIFTGFILGILFDIFRVSRSTFKTSDIITNIEDIIFGILSGIIIIISIYIFNSGALRLYILFGILGGFILYELFISKYFIKISLGIIKYIKKAIKIVIIPFNYIYKILRKLIFRPFSFIFINIRKIITKSLIKYSKIIKKYK